MDPSPRGPQSPAPGQDDDDSDWELVSTTNSTTPPWSYSPPPPPLPPPSSQLSSRSNPAQTTTTKQNAFEIATVSGKTSAAASGSISVSASVVASPPAIAIATYSKTIIMPGWKDEYLASLLEAEKNSPVNFELVDACSHLNDRIAVLEAEKAQWQSTTTANPDDTLPPSDTAATTTTTTTTDPLQTRLRADLATTLQKAANLDTRLRTATAERDRLHATTRAQAKTIAALTAERDAMRQKLRDQAEELRGKKRLLDNAQDEVVALNMQLNVAEQQKLQVVAENKTLVERWMQRARQEADLMNAAMERGGPS